MSAARELVGMEFAALGVIREDRLVQFVHEGPDVAAVARIGHLPEGKGLLGHLVERPAPLRRAPGIEPFDEADERLETLSHHVDEIDAIIADIRRVVFSLSLRDTTGTTNARDAARSTNARDEADTTNARDGASATNADDDKPVEAKDSTA